LRTPDTLPSASKGKIAKPERGEEFLASALLLGVRIKGNPGRARRFRLYWFGGFLVEQA